MVLASALLCLLWQVERQIEQMVRFIKQEAEEKANEIKVSAEEVSQLGCTGTLGRPCEHMASHTPLHVSQEFNLEKLQLLEQEKAKIRKEYERRESQVEVKKKM
jgi:V-type H+-transporting ATPase subunit E